MRPCCNHRSTASRAHRPTGTKRSLEPLPYKRTSPPSRSISPMESPQISEMRAPVAYNNSNKARSLKATELSPTTAAKRLSTSSSLKGLGIPVGTFTPSKSAVGSSPRVPSANRKRCIIRTAAMRRATLEGAAPELRCKATYASMSRACTVAKSIFFATNQSQ